MYEINLIIWPALYGYTGWLWGNVIDWPTAVTIASVGAGIVVGGLIMGINPYGVEMLQFYLLLILPWFVDAETWRWILLAMCIVPLPRLLVGLAMGKKWT